MVRDNMDHRSKGNDRGANQGGRMDVAGAPIYRRSKSMEYSTTKRSRRRRRPSGNTVPRQGRLPHL